MARSNFKIWYKPGKCQSIDEGMIKYKGNYFAKQYMPAKPIKRGLKVNRIRFLFFIYNKYTFTKSTIIFPTIIYKISPYHL